MAVFSLAFAACQTVDVEPFSTSVARLTEAPLTAESLKESLKATVDHLAEPLLESHRNIGMVIGIATPAGDMVYTYGTKDLEGNVPMTRDAVFQIGSVTKSFTSVLAAELEREHRLNLDAPVNALIPASLRNAKSDLGHVTLAQLASHTSGLPHEGYTFDLLWGVTTYLLSGKNLYRYYNTAVLENYARTYEFAQPPVRQYAYSNIGLTYMGWVLGQIDGKGYRRLLQEKVLDPLGLRNTGISLPEVAPRLTPGYAGDLPTFVSRHSPVDPWLFDDGIAAAGGLYSTVDDLLHYAKANIGAEPSPLLEAMTTTQIPRAAAEGGKICLSWFIKTLPATKQPYTYIAGIVGGHTSFVGYDRSRQIAVVVLQNSINHDDMIAVPLLDRLVGAAMARNHEMPTALSAASF